MDPKSNENKGTDKATWESYLGSYQKDKITDISRKGCIGIKKITQDPML